ncbi:MAG: hypothetical protein N3A61_06230 [Ignavibacteria bacterium]|nr:hypothetical protein [Ignavibacteria bacterium]
MTQNQITTILCAVILLIWNLLLGPRYDDTRYLKTEFQPSLMSLDVIRTVNSIENYKKLDVKTKKTEEYSNEINSRNIFVNFPLKDYSEIISTTSPVIRSPIYPIITWIIAKIQFSDSLRIQSILLIQRFLDSLIILMMFSLILFYRNSPLSVTFFFFLFYLFFAKKIFRAQEASLLIVDSSLIGFSLFLLIVFFYLSLKSSNNLEFYFYSLLSSIIFMLRNEYIILLIFLWLTLVFRRVKQKRINTKSFLLALLLLIFLPCLWGARNYYVYDDFIIFRTQGGQNLFEAIGQFENKLGIQYSDTWAISLVEKENIIYGSKQADEYFFKEYKKILFDHPDVLIKNFVSRIKLIFSSDLILGFGFVLILILYIVLTILKTIPREISFPLLAVFLYVLLFYSWTHYLGRFVYPLTYISLLITVQTIFGMWDYLKLKIKTE